MIVIGKILLISFKWELLGFNNWGRVFDSIDKNH